MIRLPLGNPPPVVRNSANKSLKALSISESSPSSTLTMTIQLLSMAGRMARKA
jgi:hypothetical protein